MEESQQEVLKKMLVSLSLDEHRGDVADTLYYYAPLLGLPAPKYCWECDRPVFEWEEKDEEHEHEFED